MPILQDIEHFKKARHKQFVNSDAYTDVREESLCQFLYECQINKITNEGMEGCIL